MRVYLAARYSRGPELLRYQADLAARGIEVTSRWIDGRHTTPPSGIDVDSHQHLRWAAEEDLADLDAADVLVAFTEPPESVPGGRRGGRHVELGYAIASHKGVIVCGYRENVFCHLPQVYFAPDWRDARDILVGLSRLAFVTVEPS